MSKLFSIFTMLADWLTYGVLRLDPTSWVGASVHFFIEDVTKIFVLVVILIYLIGLFRASMDVDKIRNYLQGKHRFVGYFLAAMFGAITPFCSCSSIPLFLAFTAARIPIGITMSFLITSPIVNEVAVLVLGSVLGWKFTIIYIGVGMLAGVIGGIFFDLIKAERYLTELGSKSKNMKNSSDSDQSSSFSGNDSKQVLSWSERHEFARGEVSDVFGRIWKWVLIGVAVGALFHGLVPATWVQKNLSAGQWWTVPLASVLGIPLYSNATGIIPVAESMLSKGIPLGTVLAFMMSVVGASFPEFIMLKQVMKTKLLVCFFFVLLVLFSITGWIFNGIAPLLGI
ncbi:MAG: permease [Kiritimatiellae bacterium]|jgi:uncharacterized membrane protein YraQ (UPF0718 family)|nr:permease [Kiritimatiellia bacterium]